MGGSTDNKVHDSRIYNHTRCHPRGGHLKSSTSIVHYLGAFDLVFYLFFRLGLFLVLFPKSITTDLHLHEPNETHPISSQLTKPNQPASHRTCMLLTI